MNSINFCNDWVQFKDKKCFKVVEKVVNQNDALKECSSMDKNSSLVKIHSQEEQKFIEQIISKFNNETNFIWIGLQYNIEKHIFQWDDGTIIDFENWAKDAVKDGQDECARMSINGKDFGKWIDESCKKNALIVCEKKIINSFDILTEAIDKLESRINAINNQLLSRIIPIGFIYAQLPNQNDPKIIWPQFKWREITNEYAGSFFRAEGGDSAHFGEKQSGNAPRLISVKFHANVAYRRDAINMVLNGESPVILTGYEGGSDKTSDCLSFIMSGGEVRPLNMAFKLWKRVE